MVVAPLPRLGVAGVLSLDPLADRERITLVLERTQLAAEGHRLDPDPLGLDRLDGRGAAIHDRPQALGLVGDGVLEGELLGQLVGPARQGLELEVTSGDGISVGALDGTDGVHAVGDFGRLVGELLDQVHGRVSPVPAAACRVSDERRLGPLAATLEETQRGKCCVDNDAPTRSAPGAAQVTELL